MRMDDRELVDSILNDGDVNLYKIVVEKYSSRIFSKVLSLVKRNDLAAELTHQSFVKAYLRLDTFRGENLAAWITSIAMHLALNALYKEGRRKKVSIDNVQLPEREDYSEENEKLLTLMEGAIEKLPNEDKIIIKEHYYKGRKTADIAKSLGLTGSNVLVRLHRIRERLKIELKNERF